MRAHEWHGYEHRGQHCAASSPSGAILVVTINPEARVEVARTDVRIAILKPREWAEIPVAIVNEGYVTGPLQVVWADVSGVEVNAPGTELTGAPLQETELRVRLAEPGAVDLTLRFWALGSLGGLANKNTIHLYMRCRGKENVIAGRPRGVLVESLAN